MNWFDASRQRSYDAEQTAYRGRARRADHWGRFFFLARAEAQRVYGAARKSLMNIPGIL